MHRNSAIAYTIFFLIAELVIVWYLSAFIANSSNYIAKSIAIMTIADVIAFTLSGCFSIYILLTGKSKIWMEKLINIAFILFLFFGGVIFSSFSLLVDNIFSGIAAILAILACLAFGFYLLAYTYQFTVFALKNEAEKKFPREHLFLENINKLRSIIETAIDNRNRDR